MKVNKIIAVALAFYTASSFAAETQTLCQKYAATIDYAKLGQFKTVNANKLELSQIQLAMVQMAVMLTDLQPMSPAEALAEFKDSEGMLHYDRVAFGNGHQIVVRVVYAPGENEYGALFGLYGGPHLTPKMIGTIQDGDIDCLTFGY